MSVGSRVVQLAVGLTVWGAADAFSFAPEPGTELERRWSESLELEVDSLEETIGGNPVDLPFASIEFTARRSFELTDVLEEVGGGRATSLARSFSTSDLGLELVLDGESVGGAEGNHGCDGATVRFRWEVDDERYGRELVEAVEGGELDPERLEGLEPDLDLLGLLPVGELEPGATFEPDLETLRAFFRAGGELGYTLTTIHLHMNEVPAELMVAGALGSLHELFAPGSELSGKLAGRYAGKEGEEGAELARLEYELELDVTADLGERFRSFMKESTPESHGLRLSAELEGELVLLWDLAARRPRSARFEGELALEGHLVFPVRMTAEAEPQEFVGDYELSGAAVVELLSE